ncbi:hypothetical protein ACIG3E_28235 [Streptomyces sp. NPDC053474]|uniref:hypothetical protein n=1 Tax=Streptomyces sp. NPDC053474 TaxID=3365704 RepID=UPI0037D2623B
MELSSIRRGVRMSRERGIHGDPCPSAAAFADRVVFFADGRIGDELEQSTAEAVLDWMKALDPRRPR